MSGMFGVLDPDTVLPDLPHLTSLDAPTWELPGARFMQINWEVESAGALQLTPPSLSSAVPPYAALFAAQYPDSPVGPFTLAQVRLVLRAGMRTRALCIGAVCDSPSAVDALRTHWGYPVELGEVEATFRHDQTRFTGAVDGRTVLDMAVRSVDVMNTTDISTFDNLHLVRLEDQPGAKLVQVDPEYALREADRGRPSVSLPDPHALGMRGNLRLTTPIIGFTFRADSDLVPIRFVLDSVDLASSSTKRVAEGSR